MLNQTVPESHEESGAPVSENDNKEDVASENTTTDEKSLYKWDEVMEMYRPDLYRADLPHADLRWAKLRWANMKNADLSNADLYMADLSEARNLRWAKLPEGWSEALEAAGLI